MSVDIAGVALQFVQTYVLPGLGVGLAGLLTVWVGQWQARAKMATMHKNADLAVRAAEQMKKTSGMSNEDAAKYALSLAQTYNKLSSINVSDDVALSMNEGYIPTLPKNVAVSGTTNTTTTTTVSSVSAPTVPAGETIDENSKALG
jgi:hypothetical protein